MDIMERIEKLEADLEFRENLNDNILKGILIRLDLIGYIQNEFSKSNNEEQKEELQKKINENKLVVEKEKIRHIENLNNMFNIRVELSELEAIFDDMRSYNFLVDDDDSPYTMNELF